MTMFLKGISIKVGSGTNTGFWKDKQYSPCPLKTEVPTMYSLAINKIVLALDYWETNGVGFGWNV